MEEKLNSGSKAKGFLRRLIEKIDKKIEEKAKASCCGTSNKDNKSCCS